MAGPVQRKRLTLRCSMQTRSQSLRCTPAMKCSTQKNEGDVHFSVRLTDNSRCCHAVNQKGLLWWRQKGRIGGADLQHSFSAVQC